MSTGRYDVLFKYDDATSSLKVRIVDKLREYESLFTTFADITPAHYAELTAQRPSFDHALESHALTIEEVAFLIESWVQEHAAND